MLRSVLGVLAVAGVLAASASAAPVYTKQDCFNPGGVNGCAASPQLGAAIAAVPSPDGRHVYGVAGAGGITVFNRTASNGALARVAGCYQATTANGCTAYESIVAPYDLAFGDRERPPMCSATPASSACSRATPAPVR
jgi:hypothetical protein